MKFPMVNAAAVAWPVKTREMHNHHMNSEVWNAFKFRPDDIVTASYGKSGTTWTQQILGQLILQAPRRSTFRSSRPGSICASSAGGDRGPRTHPSQALRQDPPARRRAGFSPKAKYLYIGRDGRDAIWSMYNHHANANEVWYDALNNTPGLVGPPIERTAGVDPRLLPAMVRAGRLSLLAVLGKCALLVGDPRPAEREADPLQPDEGRSAGLDPGDRGIPRHSPSTKTKFPAIVEHCTFDYMKAHAELAAPLGGMFWEGGARTFINKGTNGRWRDTLTPEDIQAYEAKAPPSLGRNALNGSLTEAER